MKILYVNKFFYLKGGAERVLFQEREHALAQGHKVLDFAMADERNLPSPTSRYFAPYVDYYEAGGAWKRLKTALSFIHSGQAVKRLKQLLKEHKPDIAHLHNVYHQLTPSIIPVLRKHGVRTLLTVHDGKLVCPAYVMLGKGKICTACQGRRFHKPVTTHCQGSRTGELLFMAEAYWHRWKRSYDGVDLFLTPSRFYGDMIAKWRVPEEKVRVLHNGMDLQGYSPDFGDKGHALFFGRLSREKGVETLLEAHALLETPPPLKIAGSGPLMERLKETKSNVEFLGRLSGEELKDAVRGAMYVVVPSNWYENCSMAVLEAMALGKPVIASRVGGLPEQVLDEETGLLFTMGDAGDLADKMDRLNRDKDLRKRMGRAGRERVEKHYDLRVHLQELEGVYRELCP